MPNESYRICVYTYLIFIDLSIYLLTIIMDIYLAKVILDVRCLILFYQLLFSVSYSVWWSVLARLTYNAYLLHMPVIYIFNFLPYLQNAQGAHELLVVLPAVATLSFGVIIGGRKTRQILHITTEIKNQEASTRFRAVYYCTRFYIYSYSLYF
uniref:G protein-coupled receptor n=1 Tax=Heterorhabditis bacteriophora TaxID=37862 RepID=A0A1I7X3C6_HETBA